MPSGKNGVVGKRARWVLVALLCALPASALLTLGLGREHRVAAAGPGSLAPALEGRFTARLAMPRLGDRSAGQSLGLAAKSPEVSDSALIGPRATIEPLVRDLAHDEVRWNALRAMHELRTIGAPAVPYLKGALRSRDRQQRQLAGVLLYELLDEPVPELLLVAVEGLEHDRLPYDSGWPEPSSDDRQTWINNAQAASRFLHRHPAQARPWLRRRLGSQDGQQRFLSACNLAWGSTESGAELGEAIGLTVGVLADHLRDNRVPKDGVVAASALAHLGAGALPHLRDELGRSDEQARSFLAFLIEHAESPSHEPAVIRERIRRHGLQEHVSASETFALHPMVGETPEFNDRTARIRAAPPH